MRCAGAHFGSVKLRMSGRSGHLVFSDGVREAFVYVEVAGVAEYDLLVWTKLLREWSTGEQLTIPEREHVLGAFSEWASREGVACEW